jgi:hypothetical protein
MNPVSEPLMCKVYNNGGMPIKTKLAEKFPTLSRRHRRELERKARKMAATAKPE